MYRPTANRCHQYNGKNIQGITHHTLPVNCSILTPAQHSPTEKDRHEHALSGLHASPVTGRLGRLPVSRQDVGVRARPRDAAALPAGRPGAAPGAYQEGLPERLPRGRLQVSTRRREDGEDGEDREDCSGGTGTAQRALCLTTSWVLQGVEQWRRLSEQG